MAYLFMAYIVMTHLLVRVVQPPIVAETVCCQATVATDFNEDWAVMIERPFFSKNRVCGDMLKWLQLPSLGKAYNVYVVRSCLDSYHRTERRLDRRADTEGQDVSGSDGMGDRKEDKDGDRASPAESQSHRRRRAMAIQAMPMQAITT